MSTDTLTETAPGEADPNLASRPEQWLVALVLIWGATWLNLRGTRAVGTASGWLIAAVLAPFALLAVVALGRWVFGPAAVAASFRPFANPGQTFFAMAVGSAV